MVCGNKLSAQNKSMSPGPLLPTIHRCGFQLNRSGKSSNGLGRFHQESPATGIACGTPSSSSRVQSTPTCQITALHINKAGMAIPNRSTNATANYQVRCDKPFEIICGLADPSLVINPPLPITLLLPPHLVLFTLPLLLPNY